MAQFEYEHRWLVRDPPDLTGHFPTVINQAYLLIMDGYAIRVRRAARMGPSRQLTETWETIAVKGPRVGTARAEEEWPLSADLATALYRLAEYKVVKSRYQFVYGDFLWELDQFHLANEGLYIAECEVERGGMQPTRPEWCYRDITGDNRYNNEQLAMNPYSAWPPSERGY